MREFRANHFMTTMINTLKLKGIDEDTIYKRYLDGINLETEEEISLEQIKLRVEYLKDMTQYYVDLW